MKYTLYLLAAVFCCSCHNSKSPKTIAEPEKEKIVELSPFEKELDSLHHTGVFNGFSVGIVDSSGIVYNQGFGYADVASKKAYDEKTIINIASISKVFIGIAVIKAKEMGLLDLDDPINKYLPFQVINPNHPNEQITIRQLATHTSSIVDTERYMETCYINQHNIELAENLHEKYGTYYQNPSKDEVSLEAYLGKLLQKDGSFYDASSFANRKPGELREYSNIGAALCALVIESASKQPFNAFTEQYIFEPLGMSSTHWFFEEADSANFSKLYYDEALLPYYKILSYPDGGLITSNTDLSLFLVELIRGNKGGGTILNAESFAEIFKSQLDKKALDGKENFNVGLFLDKELAYNVIGHSGGDPGTNTMMYFDSKTGKGKIFITNTDSKKENSRDVMWGIWNALDKFEK